MPSITADGVYYVDLGSDPAFGTGSFVSVYPENCNCDRMIRGVGNITFQLSFSATDQDGNPAVTAPALVGSSWVPFIGPYRTYWRLRYGNQMIMAGILTNTSSAKGSDFMSISGKTWEHLFEKMIYPDNARAGYPNDYVFSNSFQGDEYPTGAGNATPTDLVYEAHNRDLIRILRDIVTMAQSGTASNPILHRVPIDLSAINGLSGVKHLYFTYTWGDLSTMDQAIAQLADYDVGFDWWITYGGQLQWASPYRYGSPDSPFLFDTLTDTSPGTDITFNNNGPIATHIIGTGTGWATGTALRRSWGSLDNQIFFCRLDTSQDFGDERNVDALNKRTIKQLNLDVQPQHEIPLVMKPSEFTNYWTNYRVGRAIGMTMDFFYHKVISPQQLVSFQANITNEGESTVNWTIQQIYPINMDAGTAEG
jgi:hypothetical protein